MNAEIFEKGMEGFRDIQTDEEKFNRFLIDYGSDESYLGFIIAVANTKNRSISVEERKSGLNDAVWTLFKSAMFQYSFEQLDKAGQGLMQSDLLTAKGYHYGGNFIIGMGNKDTGLPTGRFCFTADDNTKTLSVMLSDEKGKALSKAYSIRMELDTGIPTIAFSDTHSPLKNGKKKERER